MTELPGIGGQRPDGLLADAPLRAYVAACQATPPVPLALLGASRLRAAARMRARQSPPGPQVEVVEEHTLPDGASARGYRPRRESLPLVVYVHGGGFVTGDLDTHDRLARRLAVYADVTVLAVEYRLAPEHPAPAAVDDIVAAVGWATTMSGLLGGDPAYGVSVAGDSAGALLATCAALRLRDLAYERRADPLAGLLLLTPLLDLTLSQPSVTAKGRGWGLDRDDLSWYVEQWVPRRPERTDPQVNPTFATLLDLPPTYLVTAEHDPLVDEGLWFARRLSGAGVPVAHRHLAGLPHGFFQMDTFSPAARAAGDEELARYGGFLRQHPPIG